MSDGKIKIPKTAKEFDELLDSDCPHCKYVKKQERSRFREMVEKKVKEEQIKIIDSKALDPQKCEVHTGKINVLREILAEIDAESDSENPHGRKGLKTPAKGNSQTSGVAVPSETSRCECGHDKDKHIRTNSKGGFFCVDGHPLSCGCPRFKEAKE